MCIRDRYVPNPPFFELVMGRSSALPISKFIKKYE
jgi:hypothetical protein